MVHVPAGLDVELDAVAAISAPRDPREVDRNIARGEAMTRRLTGCLALTALFLIPAASSADVVEGDTPAVYDTVDAVEVWGNRIIVTGIVAGQGTVTEIRYIISDGSGSNPSSAGANRCDRLALLAIAKPGKYQFATTRAPTIGVQFGCKLIVRAP